MISLIYSSAIVNFMIKVELWVQDVLTSHLGDSGVAKSTPKQTRDHMDISKHGRRQDHELAMLAVP